MVSIEINGKNGITPSFKIVRAASQPTTLSFHQDCHIPHKLFTATDLVKFTDDDLGLLFDGEVVEQKDEGAPDGEEGAPYVCADIGRFLQKQPAYALCSNSKPPFTYRTANGSPNFHIKKGTLISDAVNLVTKIAQMTNLNKLTAIHIEDQVGSLELLEDLDKGGMSIAEWLDAILDQTEGGIWYTKGTELFIQDYYKQAPLTLREGDFTERPVRGVAQIISQSIGESTNNKFGSVKAVGKGRFKRRTWDHWHEGEAEMSNNFDPLDPYTFILGLVRQSDDLGSTGRGRYDGGAHNNWTFGIRIYLPHSICLDKYFTEQLLCASGVFIYYEVQFTDGSSIFHNATGADGVQYRLKNLSRDYDPFPYDVGPSGQLKGAFSPFVSYGFNDVVRWQSQYYKGKGSIPPGHYPPNPAYWAPYGESTNPRHGQFYIQLAVGISGDADHRPGPPNFISVKARYTAYEGSMIETIAGGARLAGQGEYIIQKTDCAYYDQDEVRDPYTTGTPATHVVKEANFLLDDTAELNAYATVYGKRFTGDPHKVGTVIVHIPRGGNPLKTLTLGTKLPFYGEEARVRQITFDPVARNVELEVSTIPLRETLKLVKNEKIRGEVLYKNWRSREAQKCQNADPANCLPTIVLDQECGLIDDANTCNPYDSGQFDSV